MDCQHPQTIIKNPRAFFLNSYLSSFPFVDNEIINDFKKSFINKNLEKHGPKIIKLLNLYFYLKDINLTYLEFKNKNLDAMFNDFLKFITSNLVTTAKKSKQAYRNNLIRIIDIINENRPNKIKIDENISFDNKYNFSHHKNKIAIINGVAVKKKHDSINFTAIPYANHFGFKSGISLYDKISLFKNHNCLNTSTLGVFNHFLSFLIRENIRLEKTDDRVLAEFVFEYFKDLEKRKVNIEVHKPVWNGFIEFIEDVFNLGLDKNFLTVRTKRVGGNQTNITTNRNGTPVKNKLLTEVPLEICDEKAMYLLKEKSFQDIEIIKAWARSVVGDYKYQQTIGLYPPDEFFIENPIALRNKYKMWHEGGAKKWIENNLNTDAILNKNHITAIFCLLTINHPAITPSFIQALTTKSIVKTDQGTFLVGQKRRKGKNTSEQKILLNEESSDLVDLLLNNNKKMGKITNSDSLTLHTTPMSVFKIFPLKKIEITESINDSLFQFINSNYNIEEKEIKEFIKKIKLSTIRATCGINAFFKYESTKKMAEILGHEEYKASILSHYLPEPIIHFYQSRWIRIFQKGIIYEAMKDSDNVLEAVGFENMKTLDEFLRNHTLKNLPDNFEDKDLNDESEIFDECYVAINEENLTALWSIKMAVDHSNSKEKINERAFFWKTFAERLVNEIENNKVHYSFYELFLEAKKKSNNNFKLYEKIIYA